MSNPSQGTPVPSVFQFDSRKVRALDLDGGIWFVASDVCKALEYRDASNAARILDDDERGTHNVSTPSGEQQMLIINESGLYSLILRSRKPEAKRFKKWVTSEVLPAIRKTGRYETPAKNSDIRVHHSSARIDIALHPDSSGDIHYIGLTASNAAEMLRIAAHALLKVAGVNCGEENVMNALYLSLRGA